MSAFNIVRSFLVAAFCLTFVGCEKPGPNKFQQICNVSKDPTIAKIEDEAERQVATAKAIQTIIGDDAELARWFGTLAMMPPAVRSDAFTAKMQETGVTDCPFLDVMEGR